MTIQEKQNEIIETFSMLGDWMEKYEHIISLGKELPLLQEDQKNDDLLIKGCQSKVWLLAEFKDGNVWFKADSDAIITKGLISLLIDVLNGQSPKDIAKEELFFLDKIGLNEHLSPTRANGLLSMVKQMKLYAVALAAKQMESGL